MQLYFIAVLCVSMIDRYHARQVSSSLYLAVTLSIFLFTEKMVI